MAKAKDTLGIRDISDNLGAYIHSVAFLLTRFRSQIAYMTQVN